MSETESGTSDLNERCDTDCLICGPLWKRDQENDNPLFPPVYQMPSSPVYRVPPWEDDE